MKLLIESWRNFINEEKELAPQVVTVDFDDTIRMLKKFKSKDKGKPDTHANKIVIEKIKEFKADGAKVYIVTSRKETQDNKLFIDDFLDENIIGHDGIHLTDLDDKWYNLKVLGSDIHFDDDDEEFKAIRHHIEEFPKDKQNIKLMKVNYKTGKFKKWKEELGEVYTDKQRRWACSQIDNPGNLTKKQAKEMCKGPKLKKK